MGKRTFNETGWFDTETAKLYLSHCYRSPDISLFDVLSGKKTKKQFDISKNQWLADYFNLTYRLKLIK